MAEGREDNAFTVASSGEDLRFAARTGDLQLAEQVLSRYQGVSNELARFMPAVLASADRLSGNKALHLCAANGHIDIVRLLVRNNVDVNTTNQSGSTPLHYASLTGQLEIVKELINYKANPVVENKYRRTALDEARSSKQNTVAEFLLDHVEKVGSTPDLDQLDGEEKTDDPENATNTNLLR